MLKRILACAAMLFLMGGTTALAVQGEAPSRAKLPEFHKVHINEVGIGCTDCHAVPDNPAKGMELSFTVRPGHDNCNICHEDEFDAGEFVTLCLTCHTDDSFDLGEFPSGNSSLGEFDHARHVDPKGRVSQSTGMRQDCVFCHEVQSSAVEPGFPDHPQCVACHAGSGGMAPLISKGGDANCQGCHNLAKMDYTIRNRGGMSGAGMLPPWLAAAPAPAAQEAAYGEAGHGGSGHLGRSWEDVKRFPHGAHAKDRTGAGINCVVCHESLTKPATGEPVAYPGMNDCAVCHQQVSRVGSENTIEKCEVCHLEINAGTVPGEDGKLAHIAHHPGFNLNHQLQARDEGNYCSYCHDLQRVSSNACADCHQQLQPASHLAARFTETTHGRLASMDRENCAVCHESDFCIRCHNIPPRSHNPLPLFAAGLHRNLAALNLRSCFACHTFEANCLECHERNLRAP